MAFDSLPEGWELWNEGETEHVLVYRPDVFDSHDFPAPCLPTLYLTKGQRGRRPGQHHPAPDDPWYVTLSLEPEVTRDTDRYDDRDAAIEGALRVAEQFAAGDIDYRALYQVPREEYLDELDRLTGRA